MKEMLNWEKIRNGDSESLRTLYRDVLPNVKIWVQQNSGDSAQAADIFQEVLLAIISGKVQSKDIDGPEAFIFKMCKYKWIDHIRKNKTFQKVISGSELRHEIDESVEQQIIAIEKRKWRYEILEKGFQHLSPTCQELLNQIRQGATVEDIVENMQFNSVNTLYRRKFACIDTWRKAVTHLKQDQLI